MVGRQFILGTSVSVLALLAGGAAGAQTVETEAPEAPAASPAPQQGQAGEGVAQATPLDTISVTATRNPIETFEYPGMVTVIRSEEHTSELQSLMRISYAVFCLKKKKTTQEEI